MNGAHRGSLCLHSSRSFKKQSLVCRFDLKTEMHRDMADQDMVPRFE